MEEQEIVLCAASAYERKFYLNELFQGLPARVKDELKIMCALFTEDVGGILELVYNEDGELEFRTSADEADYLYDEIGSVLKVKELQRTKSELLESLQIFYKVLVLGEFEEE
ncbi:MAG: hypothetical protein J6A75_12555 [Lachnospiraceae bacterium]|nr:hypothetical protein [Lachnospiraceae bacterium]